MTQGFRMTVIRWQQTNIQRVMLAAGRRRLLLTFLLLLFPHNSIGMDGCQGNNGNYWRCGDICTHEKNGFRPLEECNCGDTKFSHSDDKWCCGSNCTGGCLRWKEGYGEGSFPSNCAEWSPAICATGVALNLNQSCKGACNFHG